MPRFDVKVDDGSGRLLPFQLALDDKGQPLYTQHLLEPVHISIYSQSEEARYANLLPSVGSIYAQDDLSGGIGKKTQVRHGEPGFTRYYYADWMDLSVRGQGQKGPAAVTLTAPANSGNLTGYFELAGVPYLMLGRIIASWASDSLTQVLDATVGVTTKGAATFIALGAETSIESMTTTGSDSSTADPDTWLAQSVRLATTGINLIGRVDVSLKRTGTVTGNARLRIMADKNGRPDRTSVFATATMLATDVGTSNTVMSFRFDDDQIYPIVYNEQFWLVLDCAGATASTTMAWNGNAADAYARGGGFFSTDGGNKWTAATPADHYFNIFAKSITTTVFAGRPDATFRTSTNGTVYSADTYRQSTLFAVVGGMLVRDVIAGDALTATAIETSVDGVNWSEAQLIGSPAGGITGLLNMSELLVVCKEDGVFVVDLTTTANDTEQVYAGNKVATNGQGACVWRGAAYIPFNGRLMALEGDFTNGFTVHESVGIESLPEWDWPWGAGRHLCSIGTRFHLYSLVVTGSTTKLFKCANPLKKTAEGLPDPDWHGSLATVGRTDATMLAHFDPGGTSSPQLFMSLANNNIQRIQLPRSFNPAADASYLYDNSTTGDLYFPQANGNYPVHPKAWLVETTTFLRKTASDYTEMLYDDFNGEGWRRLPRGRQYDTGALPYPRGLASTLLARRLQMTNSLQTTCPLLSAHSVSMAVRHIKGAVMREISFTVVAEDGLSAADLGEMLGQGGSSAMGVLDDAAGGGGGTRRMEDPWGRVYERVQFLDVTRVLQQTGRDGPGRTLLQVSAVAVT